MIPLYLDTPPLPEAPPKGAPLTPEGLDGGPVYFGPKSDPVDEGGRCTCVRPRSWMSEDSCLWCEG